MITGAASGIGAALAGELSAAGASLVLTDRDAAGAAACAATLPDDRTIALAVDVADEPGLDMAMRSCEATFDRLDFVIANAGVGWAGAFVAADGAAWRRVLETNVIGLALTLRAALKPMLARGTGHLIAIASLSGVSSYPGETVYVASKWAVVGLMRALRTELIGTPIRLTTVLPGLVDTPMSRASAVAAPSFSQLDPLKSQDVARAVIHALVQPEHVEISEVVVRPHGQPI